MKLPNPIRAHDIYENDAFLKCPKEYVDRIINVRFNKYKSFIKQKLHPSQFIPWDMENDCPMEKPVPPEEPYLSDPECDVYAQWKFYEDKFQQAEEMVLFEGLEVTWSEEEKVLYITADRNLLCVFEPENNYKTSVTFGDLCGKIDLNERGVKLLNLK